jgi:hypothetical protein
MIKGSSLIVFFFVFHLYGYSQTIPDTSNTKVKGVIKFYPLQLLGGEIRFAYEMQIKKKISWEFDASYIFMSYPFQEFKSNDGGLDFPTYYPNGFGVRNGLRYYTSKNNNHDGFYLNPLFLFKYYSYTDGESASRTDVTIFCFQALIGYKIPSKIRFSFDIYAGAGIREVLDYSLYPAPYPPFSFSDNLFSSQFGFSIGYKVMGK